jgi:hypothetical protein
MIVTDWQHRQLLEGAFNHFRDNHINTFIRFSLSGGF